MRGTAQAKLPLPAVFVVYTINGLMFAAWFVYVAKVVGELGLNHAEVGQALLGVPAGLLVGTMVSSFLMRWLPVGTVAVGGMVLFCGSIWLPAQAGDELQLALLLAVPGFFNGILDPAQNILGNVCEHQRGGRSIQPYAYAAFGLAQLVQASVAPFAIAAGVSAHRYLVTTGVVGVLAALLVMRWLIPVAPASEQPPEEAGTTQRVRWWMWVLGASVIFAVPGMSEGIWADWHGLYLNGVLEAPLATAVLGYLFLQLTIIVGRLAAPALVDRLGAFAIMLTSATLAIGGGLVIVTAPSFQIGMVGAAVLGLGIGPLGPLALSVGKLDKLAVTITTAVGYVGFVAAPALMGFIAYRTSLRIALCSIVVLMVVLLVVTIAMRGRLRRQPAAT